MAGITVRLTDTATPKLRMLAAGVNLRDVSMVAGWSVARLLRKHFAELESSRPNKQGWPRTHFWSRVARSVQNPEPHPEGAVVSINQVGIAQRLFGGVIRPKNVSEVTGKPIRYLTIPARAAAYGKRAGEFAGLKFYRDPKLGPVLVSGDDPVFQKTTVKGEAKQRKVKGVEPGQVFYWLRRAVRQEPDPSVLPDEPQFNQAATSAVGAFIQRNIERRTGGISTTFA